MSSSNCCFLTCTQISQEAGKVIWYSHLLENYPQFVVIHTVKVLGIINKAEVDFFCNSLAFSMIQRMLAFWSLVPLPFLNPSWTSGISQFTYCWSLAWRILNITLLVCEMNAIVPNDTVLFLFCFFVLFCFIFRGLRVFQSVMCSAFENLESCLSLTDLNGVADYSSLLPIELMTYMYTRLIITYSKENPH